MTNDVIVAINEYLKVRPDVEYDQLFISERKLPISKRTVQYTVDKYLKMAGLEGNTHFLRHSAASLMLENDIDPRTIQVLMGHQDIKTTEIYMKVTDKRKEF